METNIIANAPTRKEEKEIVKNYNAGMTRSEIRFRYKINNTQFTLIITRSTIMEKKKKEELYRFQ